MGMPVTQPLERDAELARLEELVDRADGGAGGVVLIEGPAGIGKSRLLAAARELAASVGMRSLEARGSELERDFALGVIRQLLEPVVSTATEEQRRELFSGAAELAAAVFEGDAAPAVTDVGFSRLHGLYWLTVNLAQQRPLLVALDDLQWADPASQRFVLFLARRLEALPILVVATVRTGEVDGDALVAQLTTETGPVTLEPAPLSPAALSDLARAALGAEVDHEFAAACHETTGGNAFFATELIRELALEQVTPTAEQARLVRALRPRGVARSVVVRLGRLGDDAVALARACAVLGDDSELRHATELAGLDEAAGAAAADALVRAGFLGAGDRLSFLHPILRAAVEAELGAQESALAHARAARLLIVAGADPDRVALHLLHAPPQGDVEVVTRLVDAARSALAHGAPEAASRLLRRALEEPPHDSALAELHHRLGIAALAAGEADAGVQLRRAFELSGPRERCAVVRPLFAALVRDAAPAEAVTLTGRALEGLPEDEREARLALEAERLAAMRLAPEGGRPFLKQAERLAGDLTGDTPGERMLLANLALARSLGPGPADGAEAAARLALGEGRLLSEQTADSPLYAWAVCGLLVADRVDEFDASLVALEEDARRRGSLMGYGIALELRVSGAHARGRVADAGEYAREALKVAREASWFAGVPPAVAYLVDAAAEAGRPEAGDALLAEFGMTGAIPEFGLFHHLVMARARLRLAQGRLPEAMTDLADIARRADALGDPVGFPTYFWRPLAAVAHAALGEAEEARGLAKEAMDQARGWGTPRVLGVALRTCGVVEGGETGLQKLVEAVEVLEESPARLELARAQTELGAALRRLRRPAEAREPLRKALEFAVPAGAARVAEQAAAELAATGERRRKTVMLEGTDALTPSERRVAEMAADGRTNKEIAQTLFVTLKTVEVHLTRAYGKLGIGGRRQLRDALGDVRVPP